jgi:hypothetical protein
MSHDLACRPLSRPSAASREPLGTYPRPTTPACQARRPGEPMVCTRLVAHTLALYSAWLSPRLSAVRHSLAPPETPPRLVDRVNAQGGADLVEKLLGLAIELWRRVKRVTDTNSSSPACRRFDREWVLGPRERVPRTPARILPTRLPLSSPARFGRGSSPPPEFASAKSASVARAARRSQRRCRPRHPRRSNTPNSACFLRRPLRGISRDTRSLERGIPSNVPPSRRLLKGGPSSIQHQYADKIIHYFCEQKYRHFMRRELSRAADRS